MEPDPGALTFPAQVLQETNIAISTEGLLSHENDPVANTTIRVALTGTPSPSSCLRLNHQLVFVRYP